HPLQAHVAEVGRVLLEGLEDGGARLLPPRLGVVALRRHGDAKALVVPSGERLGVLGPKEEAAYAVHPFHCRVSLLGGSVLATGRAVMGAIFGAGRRLSLSYGRVSWRKNALSGDRRQGRSRSSRAFWTAWVRRSTSSLAKRFAMCVL